MNLYAIIAFLFAFFCFFQYYRIVWQTNGRITDLRNKNADLIDDNRAKAKALQKLVDASEALLVNDLHHTAETLEELLESGFFKKHTLFDTDAVDEVTDWFTLERFLEHLEDARVAAKT